MSISDLLLLGVLIVLILLILCGFAVLIWLPLRQLAYSSRRPRDEQGAKLDFCAPLLDLEAEAVRERRRRWELLTLREREIARLAAEGKQNGEIAQALHVRSSTVATHLKSVYKTLGIHSRRELANVIRDVER